MFTLPFVWDVSKPNFYITQALTNHGCFKAYLKRFMVSDNPCCLCGPMIQDAKHIIEECPIFTLNRAYYRFKVKQELNKPNNELKQPKNIIKLFSAYLETIMEKIFKYNKAAPSRQQQQQQQ